MTLSPLWESVLKEFSEIWQALVLVAIAIALMYVVKAVREYLTPFDGDNEVEEKRNLAVALRRGGLFLGISIAMVGALTGGSGGYEGFSDELVSFVISGVIATILLLLVGFINDMVILRDIDNNTEAAAGNVAVGLVEAGGYVAAGLILQGSFSGEGGEVGGLSGEAGAVISAIAFTILGQLALFVMYLVYQRVTPFDVTEEIKKANAAAGIAVGGMLVALGLILRASIAGPFEGWDVDLATFGFYAVAGIVILMVVRLVADRLFLPNTNLATEIVRDTNVASLSLAYGAIIAVALVVSYAI